MASPSPTALPTPTPCDVEAWTRTHLGDLARDDVIASRAFTGGQTAADAAMEGFDVAGYATTRSEVWPPARRGASGLSPWIRHGLLPLRRVWDHVAGGPSRDVRRFRDELCWQEYARHLQARLGPALARPLRAEPVEAAAAAAGGEGPPWDRTMRCMDAALDELEGDGWVVNQVRMWLASHWSVRRGADWRAGEDAMFAHLLDGSRAANRLGWQWTAGTATGRRYGFSRWQVQKRAPQLCRECDLAEACPIEDWPAAGQDAPRLADPDPRLRGDADVAGTRGPLGPVVAGEPDVVWLTAESLGDADPALGAHPALPAVFTFDEPLLARLRLSGKRLVFLAGCLADLAQRREVEVHRGDPVAVLRGRSVATTFAPVPGWRRRSARVDLAALHPWPWLFPPHGGSVASFSAWRKGLEALAPA